MVAPLFFFAIGLTSLDSFRRSIDKDGKIKAYFSTIRRNSLLILIGIIGSIVGSQTLSVQWGILQAIGGAGLFLIFFRELEFTSKALFLVLVCLIHLFFSDFYSSLVLESKQGGVLGAFFGC